jgi:hypothetical protein
MSADRGLIDMLEPFASRDIQRVCRVTRNTVLSWKRGAVPRAHHWPRIAEMLGLDLAVIAKVIVAQANGKKRL